MHTPVPPAAPLATTASDLRTASNDSPSRTKDGATPEPSVCFNGPTTAFLNACCKALWPAARGLGVLRGQKLRVPHRLPACTLPSYDRRGLVKRHQGVLFAAPGRLTGLDVARVVARLPSGLAARPFGNGLVPNSCRLAAARRCFQQGAGLHAHKHSQLGSERVSTCRPTRKK
jgi:hypothetical protein